LPFLRYYPNNPVYSELLTNTEAIAYKPFTDVVVLGKAYTRRGKKAQVLQCEVKVGSLSKAIKD
jgi:hypothetical protein